MAIIDDESLQIASDAFVSRLRARLRTSWKTRPYGIKTLLPNEQRETKRTYFGRRYYYRIPPISPGIEIYSRERCRYLPRDMIASDSLVGSAEFTDVRSTKMALSQLIRSLELCSENDRIFNGESLSAYENIGRSLRICLVSDSF